MRHILLLAAMLTAAHASGETYTDTLPPLCDSFVYILRVKAPRASGYAATVDFGNGQRLTFDVPALADAADGHPHKAVCSLTDACGNIEATVKADVTIDAAEKGYGLRMAGNAAGLAIGFGGPHEQGTAAVPGFDTRHTASISATLPDGTAIIRRTLRAEALMPPLAAPFASFDSLKSHIAASSDPREGFYAYLDKDIPPSGAAAISRPEAYKFAIVSNPSAPGAYIIIYLGGAQGDWLPMEIKARLKPTIFINHFDLEWTDAMRRPLPGDAYAQYSEDASILTLSFPLLKASFRLAKAFTDGSVFLPD